MTVKKATADPPPIWTELNNQLRACTCVEAEQLLERAQRENWSSTFVLRIGQRVRRLRRAKELDLLVANLK
jgi:hypothetical protein